MDSLFNGGSARFIIIATIILSLTCAHSSQTSSGNSGDNYFGMSFDLIILFLVEKSWKKLSA